MHKHLSVLENIKRLTEHEYKKFEVSEFDKNLHISNLTNIVKQFHKLPCLC